MLSYSVIHNSGIFPEPVHAASSLDCITSLQKTMEINVYGHMRFNSLLLSSSLLASSPLPRIICISSLSGSIAGAATRDEFYWRNPAYIVSKAALNMWMVALARELKGKAVVGSIHPCAHPPASISWLRPSPADSLLHFLVIYLQWLGPDGHGRQGGRPSHACRVGVRNVRP